MENHVLSYSIELLTADRLAALLEWVPSHARKFAENARQSKLEGWNESFGKEESYSALAALLSRDGGPAIADQICQRAKIKGVLAAAEAKARAALYSVQENRKLPPRSSWPKLLVQAGADLEAAWILWCDHGSDLDLGEENWLADNDLIQRLFKTIEGLFPQNVYETPKETTAEIQAETIVVTEPATLEAKHSDSVDVVQADVSRWLQLTLTDPAALAEQLRSAADRLDQIALQNQAAQAAAQVSLRERLASFRTEASAVSGSTTADMEELLGRLLSYPSPLDTATVVDALSKVPGYLSSATEWRAAMDCLADTHDYAGVGLARKLEMERSGEIVALFERALSGSPSMAPDLAKERPQSVSGEVKGSAELPADNISAGLPIETKSVEPDDSAPKQDVTEIISPMTLAIGELEELTMEEADLLPVEALEHQANNVDWQLALRAAESAFSEGRYGLAVHVASVAEYGNNSAPFGFPSTLLRALCAGILVGTPNGMRATGIFARLQPAVEALISQDAGHSVNLVAFAASLRPALFSTAAGGDQVLRHLSNLQSLVPSVYGLCAFAVGNLRSGDILPSDLATLGDTLAPKAELETLRKDTERFLTSARRRTIKFQPATLIWANLLRAGPIYEAINAIISDSANAAKFVTQALDGPLANIDRLITEKDREALGGRKREPLTAKPRATLHDWLDDIAARLECWRRLHDACKKPTRDRYNVQSREELKTRLEAASAELGEIAAYGDPALQIASSVARAVVGTVLDLYDGENSIALASPEDEVLLFEPPFDLAGASGWDVGERSNFFSAAEAQALRSPDYGFALEEALKRGRLPLVASLREKVNFDDPKKGEVLDRKIRGETDRKVTQARTRLSQARARLNDLLGADDRQILSGDLSPSLDELEFQLAQTDGPVDLTLWAQSLESQEQQLQRGFLSLIGPLQAEVNRLEELGQNVAGTCQR